MYFNGEKYKMDKKIKHTPNDEEFINGKRHIFQIKITFNTSPFSLYHAKLNRIILLNIKKLPILLIFLINFANIYTCATLRYY